MSIEAGSYSIAEATSEHEPPEDRSGLTDNLCFQQGGCVMVSVLFDGLCFGLGGWFRVQYGHDQGLVIVRAAVDDA